MTEENQNVVTYRGDSRSFSIEVRRDGSLEDLSEPEIRYWAGDKDNPTIERTLGDDNIAVTGLGELVISLTDEETAAISSPYIEHRLRLIYGPDEKYTVMTGNIYVKS